jgi:DNA-binding NtrC family response regulator
MSPSDSPPSSAAKPTVLVVDDDAAVLQLCQTVLERGGFTVLPATGSSDALKICKNHSGSVDILVTDLVLPPPEFSFASGGNEFPHVHGHDLAVRALQMRKNLRIVLMSGNLDKDLAGYGIRLGALPFMEKPFEPQALINLVKQTMQGPSPTVESLTQTSKSGSKDGDEWFG